MRHSILLPIAALLTLAACKAGEGDPKVKSVGEDELYEGDEAGECTNGADDDRDGFFDCEDQGCWNSPDCGGGSGGPGGPGGTGSGTGGGTGSGSGGGTGGGSGGTGTGSGTGGVAGCTDDFCDVESFTLDYTIDFGMTAFLGFGGICPCRLTYEADGTIYSVDAQNKLLTFDGTWRQTNVPTTTTAACGPTEFCQCGPATDACTWGMAEGIWWDDPSGDAYTTFHWDSTGTILNDWVAHASPTGWLPQPPGAEPQYYLTTMGRTWPAGNMTPVVHYDLTERPADLALFGATVQHTWDASFTRGP